MCHLRIRARTFNHTEQTTLKAQISGPILGILDLGVSKNQGAQNMDPNVLGSLTKGAQHIGSPIL